MKKCIMCGKEHEGACDRSQWDGILQTKYSIPVEKIEDEALEEDERRHIAKKRGRPSKNG